MYGLFITKYALEDSKLLSPHLCSGENGSMALYRYRPDAETLRSLLENRNPGAVYEILPVKVDVHYSQEVKIKISL